MRPLTAILAALTGVAGWFYLFYSKAAAGLGGVEQRQFNRRRVRLRRLNGFVLIVLAVLLYAGTYAVDERKHPGAFVAVWASVTALLGGVVLLVLADVRLTVRLRQRLAHDAHDAPDLNVASPAAGAGDRPVVPSDVGRGDGRPREENNAATPNDPRIPP